MRGTVGGIAQTILRYFQYAPQLVTPTSCTSFPRDLVSHVVTLQSGPLKLLKCVDRKTPLYPSSKYLGIGWRFGRRDATTSTRRKNKDIQYALDFQTPGAHPPRRGKHHSNQLGFRILHVLLYTLKKQTCRAPCFPEQ